MDVYRGLGIRGRALTSAQHQQRVDAAKRSAERRRGMRQGAKIEQARSLLTNAGWHKMNVGPLMPLVMAKGRQRFTVDYGSGKWAHYAGQGGAQHGTRRTMTRYVGKLHATTLARSLVRRFGKNSRVLDTLG